jgi:hypothetical protein
MRRVSWTRAAIASLPIFLLLACSDEPSKNEVLRVLRAGIAPIADCRWLDMDDSQPDGDWTLVEIDRQHRNEPTVDFLQKIGAIETKAPMAKNFEIKLYGGLTDHINGNFIPMKITSLGRSLQNSEACGPRGFLIGTNIPNRIESITPAAIDGRGIMVIHVKFTFKFFPNEKLPLTGTESVLNSGVLHKTDKGWEYEGLER